MKGSSYRNRDYAFGQTILTLRSTIGLTQVVLAEQLGVSRKAVGEWEGGLNHPKAEHLQTLIALAVEQGAFSAGHEEEEIRVFWQAAHQKLPLDAAWLSELLPPEEIALASPSVKETIGSIGDLVFRNRIRKPQVTQNGSSRNCPLCAFFIENHRDDLDAVGRVQVL